MRGLQVVGWMLSSEADIRACGWYTDEFPEILTPPEGMFVAYDEVPPQALPTWLKIIGTNTSQPTWIERRVPVVTTRDDRIRMSMSQVTPTAEFVIGQILYLHRQMALASAQPWGDRDAFIAPAMLSRMHMTLIGFGRIGHMVSLIAEHLFASICIIDEDTEHFLYNHLPVSDVVVMCAHTDRCILTAERLGLMKPSALLVSISPPCAVNMEKAIAMLYHGRLRGLALDCHDLRTDTARELGDKLTNMVIESRLLLTSHIAGSTIDARKETEQLVLREMTRRLDA